MTEVAWLGDTGCARHGAPPRVWRDVRADSGLAVATDSVTRFIEQR